jgi:Heavy metal binding domain
MKKSVMLLVLVFCISIIAMSCKDSKKEAGPETEVEQTVLGVEKADLALNDVYQCPMGCDDGKTYDKEGVCPVCNMDLKKVEKEDKKSDSENEEHNHD